ncbi:MAG TPA: hypothetical protein VKZ85_10795 [Woeseiaceae bacterium]|jgi:hypothetical protein|nr:hypothetical protein [Woeseiaceae bacterium]
MSAGGQVSHDLSRDAQKIAVLTWASFLCAAGFSVVLFAFLDPLVLVEALDVETIDSRHAGYAIGFFFLWANGWLAAWLTARLIRRKRRGPGAGRLPGTGA